jgi:hypothetical protein
MSVAGQLDHLQRLCDERGLFEHALGRTRREDHGYCTDDNARLAVVMAREPDDETAVRLGRIGLEFVLDSMEPDGRCRNRMDRTGAWTDRASTEDCWGRALWAIGTAAAHHPDADTQARSSEAFERGLRQRSAWPRSMAFAALGASEVLQAQPDHRGARNLLIDALNSIGPAVVGGWPWPERRLSYANATLAEVVMMAGAALDRQPATDRGLSMLSWLLDVEMPGEHLSVTGMSGRGPTDTGPQFDQQPIEVSAMADACWRAHVITGDERWTDGIAAAAAWFLGRNDAGLTMFDEVSAGGYDGLHEHSVNVNQGAESTLALVSTMQRARSLAPAT